MSTDYGRRSTDLTVAPVVPVWEVCIAGQPERVLPPEWSWLRAGAAYLWLRLTAYLKSRSRSSVRAIPTGDASPSTSPAVVCGPAPQEATEHLPTCHAVARAVGIAGAKGLNDSMGAFR